MELLKRNLDESPGDRIGWAGEWLPRLAGLQVFVEPIGNREGVLVEPRPAVAGASLHDQLSGDAHFLELGHDRFRLFDRYQLVGVAMDDQGRRIVGADMR